MITKTQNKTSRNTPKLHNPKAHAPAVYIPCWLIQVPQTLLSYSGKILYGRLAQWSNAIGQVYRTRSQLAEEIGTNQKNIDRYIAELKDLLLIGTHRQEEGGISYYQFFDHPWMYEAISDQLCYKFDIYESENADLTPPPKMGVPTPKNGGTHPQKWEPININKYKQLKDLKPPIVPLKNFSDEKLKILTKLDLLENNPCQIPDKHIEEWLAYRKKPITPRIWESMINIMQKLESQGITALRAFEIMLQGLWQGMQYSYFERELASMARKNKSQISNSDMNYKLGEKSEFGF